MTISEGPHSGVYVFPLCNDIITSDSTCTHSDDCQAGEDVAAQSGGICSPRADGTVIYAISIISVTAK